MKKSLLLVMSLATLFTAKAGVITQDFNDRPSGLGYNQEIMPDGWSYWKPSSQYASVFEWNADQGVDGTACMKFQKSQSASGPYSPANKRLSAYVTEAKGGNGAFVQVEIKGSLSAYLPQLTFYKMVKNGDTYTQGDVIKAFDKAALQELGVNENTFTTVKVDLDADCYIGIEGNNFYLDNYLNDDGQGGGENPDPGPGPDPTPGNLMKITQDFNTPGTGGFNGSKLTDAMLPEGWYASLSSQWDASYNTGYGAEGSAGIKSGNSDTKAFYLITQAKGSAQNASVSFDLKWVTEPYGATPFAKLYKMTRNDDGTFTPGEMLCDFTTQMPAVTADKVWTTVTYEGPTEDCWIGLYSWDCYIDNYVNKYAISATIETYTVSGAVKCGDKAVAGATVSVPGFDPVTTDENGQFTFTEVPADTYKVSVAADGYQAYSSEITVDADITDLVISLTEMQSSLTAAVVDVKTEKVIAGATVKVFIPAADETSEPVEIASVTTDDEGKFTVVVSGKLNEGGYDVTVSAPYYQNVNTKFMSSYSNGYGYFEYGKDKVFGTLYSLRMNAAQLTMTANVKSGEAAVAGATVTMWAKENPEEVMTAVESESAPGVYTISGINALTAGTAAYVVAVDQPAYKPENKEVTFNGLDASVDFDLVAWKPTVFSGIISDKEGNPLDGAEVILVNDATELEVAMKTTGEDGAYTLTVPGILAEAYTLKVSAEYYIDNSVAISAPQRETTVENNVALEKKMYTLEVRVTDKDGKDIEGAQVALGRTELTAEDGVFKYSVWSKDAYDTTYTLQAVADGYMPASQRFEFTTDSYTHTFVLDEAELQFTGHIMNSEYEPIEGASMTVICGSEFIEVTDLGDGDYTFTTTVLSAAGKTYTVSAFAPGYMGQTKEFSFTGEFEEGADINFILEPVVYTYTATVKTSDGGDTSAAVVTVTADDKNIEVSRESDGTFTFSVPELEAADQYQVTVTLEGYDSQSSTFDFKDGSVEQTFTLQKTDSVGKIVADHNGVANIAGKLYIQGDAMIFTVDGKLVKTVSNPEAEPVDLPAGIYIVAGQKVLVK